MKYSKKNIFTTIIVFVKFIALVCCVFLLFIPLNQRHEEERLERQIIQLANEDCEINGEVESLELVDIEQVGWAKYDCYNYVLTTTTHRYWIGVMRNKKEIHFVDVIEGVQQNT